MHSKLFESKIESFILISSVPPIQKKTKRKTMTRLYIHADTGTTELRFEWKQTASGKLIFRDKLSTTHTAVK